MRVKKDIPEVRAILVFYQTWVSFHLRYEQQNHPTNNKQAQ